MTESNSLTGNSTIFVGASVSPYARQRITDEALSGEGTNKQVVPYQVPLPQHHIPFGWQPLYSIPRERPAVVRHVRRFLHINGHSVSADPNVAYAAPTALLHAVGVVVDKFIGQAEPAVLETMAADPTGREMARILKEVVFAEFHLLSDDVRQLPEAHAFADCVDVLVSTGYVVIPSQVQPENRNSIHNWD